jgi:hypothetical protein
MDVYIAMDVWIYRYGCMDLYIYGCTDVYIDIDVWMYIYIWMSIDVWMYMYVLMFLWIDNVCIYMYGCISLNIYIFD